MDEDNIKECKVMMNTPERSKNNQMATANGKFEDSPIFSFLDNLSPIKPVKSAPFTQTINPLNFASFPAVFTSPHANSLKECRFVPRHQLPDPSRPEFSFDDGNSYKSSFGSNKISDNQKENQDPMSISCHGVANYELSNDCSKLIVECAENLKYDTDAPNPTTSHPKVPFRDSQVNLEGLTQIIDQNKDDCVPSCNLDDLITDPSDILEFGLPQEANVGLAKKPVDPALSFYTSIKHAIKSTLSREQESMYAPPGQEHEMMETNDDRVLVSIKGGSLIANPCKNMDYQLPGLYRGARKRCLVYDVAGAHLKASMMRQVDENITSNQQLFLKNAADNTSSSSSSQQAFPGIGLHLNAIASNLKDNNNHVSTCRRLLVGPNSYVDLYSFEMGIDNVENGAVRMKDSGFMEAAEINDISPRKKKPRLEQGVDGAGACKRCNCKKSKCLKLYCECFAAGVYCVEPCACINCFNKPVHEDTVIATRKQIESRNPLAFAPKVIRGSDSASEIGDDFSKTPASAWHKRGCNCKKSGCLKKYCECYQSGVGCCINCRCEGCKNAFGTKDGSGPGDEYEEEEANTTEKAELSRSFRKANIHDSIEQSMDSGLSGGGRQMAQPFSTAEVSSSFPSISSSTGQGFGKSTSFFHSQLKLDQFSKICDEEQMPEFLLDGSPKRGLKSSLSPNGKRVSPPQHVERSLDLRSSRKLILQSIPSFPSLANK